MKEFEGFWVDGYDYFKVYFIWLYFFDKVEIEIFKIVSNEIVVWFVEDFCVLCCILYINIFLVKVFFILGGFDLEFLFYFRFNMLLFDICNGLDQDKMIFGNWIVKELVEFCYVYRDFMLDRFEYDDEKCLFFDVEGFYVSVSMIRSQLVFKVVELNLKFYGVVFKFC